MGGLLSINVGLPQDVTWPAKTVHTGIWKALVTGSRMVRRLNIDGDGQGDLNGHDGERLANAGPYLSISWIDDIAPNPEIAQHRLKAWLQRPADGGDPFGPKTAPPTYNALQIGRRIAGGGHRHLPLHEIEAKES